jgi:hypothetical protein
MVPDDGSRLAPCRRKQSLVLFRVSDTTIGSFTVRRKSDRHRDLRPVCFPVIRQLRDYFS